MGMAKVDSIPFQQGTSPSSGTEKEIMTTISHVQRNDLAMLDLGGSQVTPELHPDRNHQVWIAMQC
jgi:hypothetical protein